MTTHVLTLTSASRDTAHRLAAGLTELVEPAADAVSLFEEEGGWRIDAYFNHPPADPTDYARTLAGIVDAPADSVAWSPLVERNWVAISQTSLPPVEAGRFKVYGAHDRHRIPRGPWSIEIEAGEAFGTAHHATTYGCLLALHQVAPRRPPHRVLDLGTGSGVLAIATARRFPMAHIIASDLDRDSIRVARENAAKNRVASRVMCLEAAGVPRVSASRSGYDLIIANILAGPLAALAGQISGALAPRGQLILSGLLDRQAASVRAAYRAHGLIIERRHAIEGWSTLVMRKRLRRAMASEPFDDFS